MALAVTVGTDKDDGFEAVTSSSDGAVVAAGWTRGVGDEAVALIVRVDGPAKLAWAQAPLTGTRSATRAVASMADGDFALVGEAGDPWAEGRLLYLRLRGEDGLVKWMTTYTAEGVEALSGRAVAATADDGVILAGTAHTTGRADRVVVARLAQDGTPAWARAVEGAGDTRASALAVAPNGSVFLAGSTAVKGRPADAFVARLDNAGRIQWALAWGEDGEDAATQVVPAADGGLFVAAEVSGASQVLKLDAAGKVEWGRRWAGKGTPGVVATATGVIAVVPGDGAVRLEEMDGNGQRVRAWTGPKDAAPVAITSVQGVVTLAAESEEVGAGGEDGLLVRWWTSTEGCGRAPDVRITSDPARPKPRDAKLTGTALTLKFAVESIGEPQVPVTVAPLCPSP